MNYPDGLDQLATVAKRRPLELQGPDSSGRAFAGFIVAVLAAIGFVLVGGGMFIAWRATGAAVRALAFLACLALAGAALTVRRRPAGDT